MAKKLYVGSISYETNNDGLRKAFETCGTVVSANIIMDKETGKSKGFGFVEMSTDEEAASAIEKLNGFNLDGRTLRVSEARPMEKSSGGFGGGRRNDNGSY